MDSLALCECTECRLDNCGGQNPAIYMIKRNGKEMIVCSKCILGSDTDRGIIPDIDLNKAIEEAKNYDFIDILCIYADAKMMINQRKAN